MMDAATLFILCCGIGWVFLGAAALIHMPAILATLERIATHDPKAAERAARAPPSKEPWGPKPPSS